MRPPIAAAVTALLLAASAARAQGIQFLGTEVAGRPFTPVVRVDHTLYLSGQLGTDSTGKLVPGGIRAETRQALLNIKKLLEQNGSDMSHVAKCTVYMADMKEWATMNEVYATMFPDHRPARSAFGTTGL
ncbi:MAG TPA: RidA family protein, partial [Gemmatimonadaceae bacterium]|nr:RidA family protein [Gemmatimonadaceae bacterium]